MLVFDAAFHHFCRDGIGDLSVLGDRRWAGGYGIDADFIALENTHVAFVETSEIKARMMRGVMLLGEEATKNKPEIVQQERREWA